MGITDQDVSPVFLVCCFGTNEYVLSFISTIAFFLTPNFFRFKLVENSLLFSNFSTKKQNEQYLLNKIGPEIDSSER